jgi:hypothetical protein
MIVHLAKNQIAYSMKSYAICPVGLMWPVISMAALFLTPAPWDKAHAQTALVTVTNSGAVTLTTNIPVPTGDNTIFVLEKYAYGQLTLDGHP